MLVAVIPVVTAETTYVKTGYISVRIMPEGNISYHSAILRAERIYISTNVVSWITGYSIIKDGINNVYFYRPYDTMTMVFYDYIYGQAHTMGRVYDLQTIIKDGEIYFDIEKILYLLHAQWCIEDSHIIVQPMSGNLFEFWYRNFEYIHANSITHEDLLLNGENKWVFAIRTTLASVFTNIDAKVFYAPSRIRADYQEALFLLLKEDILFFNDGTINAIDAILQNSYFEGIATNWGAIYNTAGLPQNITSLINDYNTFVDMVAPSLRFNAWNDISSIDFGVLGDITKFMGTFDNILSVYKSLSNIVEVYTRSQNWNTGFIDYITLLSRICGTRYGQNGRYIRNASQALLNEKADPMRSAIAQTGWEIAGAVVEMTPVKKFLSIVSGGIAIAQTVPEISSQIETASMQYTINLLIHIEQIARQESTRHYVQYIQLQQMLTSSSSFLDLPMISNAIRTREEIEAKAIRDLRSSMMLHLRTSLRNRYFMYKF